MSKRAGLLALVLLAGCAAPSDVNARAAAGPETSEEIARAIHHQVLDHLSRYGKAVADAHGGKVVVTPQSWDPYNTPLGLGIDSATVTPDGRRLTVGFLGAKGPATVPCGIDYAAEPVESAVAVVVVLTSHPHNANDMCTLMGYPRTATLTLDTPLGKRAVLDMVMGLPVPVNG